VRQIGRRILEIPERHPGRLIAVVGLLFALAYGSSLFLLPKPGGRIVGGDALHYYVYLRSAVFDGDLHFRNDYVGLITGFAGDNDPSWLDEETPTGHTPNMMSVGPPILWSPLFVLVTLAVAAGRAMGWTYPFDGFGRLFQASAAFSGVLAATIGAWLTYRWVARVYGTRTAIWATLAMWLGSSAVYYSVIAPTYSHAASMFVTSALFFVWGTTVHERSGVRFARVGALAGACALVRWQDAVFLILLLVDAVREALGWDGGGARAGRRAWGLAARHLAIAGAAALAAFSPQIVVWLILYGRPVAMPQGGEWMQWTRPHVLQTLFSDWHGLFTWTPVVLFGVMGLAFVWRRDPAIAAGAVAAFAASLYANASVLEWWAGEAFGARRFVSCLPIFTLGLGALLQVARRSWVAPAFALVVVWLNGLLLLQYQLFMHGLRSIAPYPRGLDGLILARFRVPFELLQWLWER
jgi:hypothetical protein